MPDYKDVGDASDGIPAPLLGRLLIPIGGKEASQDHDQVCDDSHDGVCTVNTGKEAEVGEKQRRGDGPVDVASEVDLTTNVVVRVRDLVVVRLNLDAVQVCTVTSGHAEVGQGRSDCDECGDDMVETLRHGDVPGEQGEEARGYQHDHEDDP